MTEIAWTVSYAELQHDNSEGKLCEGCLGYFEKSLTLLILVLTSS